MSERTEDEIRHDRQAFDNAHVQNEAGRDAFVALAHTGLFAASIAFVGDVAPVTAAIWKPVLIAGWLASVVGLLALTWSFHEARKATNAMRDALYKSEPPSYKFCEGLNAVALWSFPVALVCLFSFVTVNVVSANDRQAKIPAATKASAVEEGRNAASASTVPSVPLNSAKRRDTTTPRALATPSIAAPAKEEVKATDTRPVRERTPTKP